MQARRLDIVLQGAAISRHHGPLSHRSCSCVTEGSRQRLDWIWPKIHRWSVTRNTSSRFHGIRLATDQNSFEVDSTIGEGVVTSACRPDPCDSNNLRLWQSNCQGPCCRDPSARFPQPILDWPILWHAVRPFLCCRPIESSLGHIRQ